MFRNEFFGSLKKSGRTGYILSLQMVNELKHRCLFFGRKRIHGFNEALAGHPDASITQARGGGLFVSTTGCMHIARTNVLDSMDFVWLPFLDNDRTFLLNTGMLDLEELAKLAA